MESDDEEAFTAALMCMPEGEDDGAPGNASQHLGRFKHVHEYVAARNELAGLIRGLLATNGSEGDAELVSLQVSDSAAVSFLVATAPVEQQHCVWDCAVVLSLVLRRNPHIVRGKRVLELGCAVALPSFAAAACGAERVTATDMEGARVAVERMWRMNPAFADRVAFQTFHWGETDEQTLQCPYDVILCSDLIYGDATTSQLLADTLIKLVRLCPGVRVVSCHERRWAGDHGVSWMTMLKERGFVLETVPLPEEIAVHPAAGDRFAIHEQYLPAADS